MKKRVITRRRALAARSVRTLAMLVAAASAATPVCGEPIISTWVEPLTGNWHVGSNWSTNPIAPNNGSLPNVSYGAVINSVGGSYTVDLNADSTVDSFLLDSPDAIVNQTGGTFRSLHGMDLKQGAWRLKGTIADTTITSSGTGQFVVIAPPSFETWSFKHRSIYNQTGRCPCRMDSGSRAPSA